MRRALGYLTLLAAVAAGGVGGYTTLTGEPNEIRLELSPAEVTARVDELFTVELEVENVDLDAVPINAVALEQSLLDGVFVAQTDPIYRDVEERSYPVYGDWTEYAIVQTLRGGEKTTITLTLKATTSGTYSGDVMVWVDSDVMGVTVGRARRAPLDVVVQ